MARSRLAISADQSVTTCPSTHDTMSSLESSSSGPTRPGLESPRTVSGPSSLAASRPQAQTKRDSSRTNGNGRSLGASHTTWTSLAGSAGPEKAGRSGIGELQREGCGIEVLVVELQPSKAPFQGKGGLARTRLGPGQVLKAEHRNHRLDDDHRRHVLPEAGMPAPPVMQVVLARPVEYEGVRLGDVAHGRSMRGKDEGAGRNRPAVGDARALAARTCEAAPRPAAAGGALPESTYRARARLSVTRVPLRTFTASSVALAKLP